VFNYSNLGPDIAGAALERLSGRSFDSAVRSTLLEPLGMPRSSFTLTDTVRAAMAHGHVKGRPRDPIPIRDAPAGGLVSNVEELARFMRMVLRGGELDGVRVLKPETVTAMLTPQFTDAPYDFGQHFGLGWMLSGIPLDHAGRTAWHNGGTKSFLSQLIVLPEKNLGVVVLANADSAAPLVYETAETLLRLALEVRDGIRPNPPPAKLPEIALDAVTLERYAGDYSLMGALVHLRRRDNRLEFQLFEHRLELVPVGGAQFRAEYRLAGPLVFRVPTFPPIEFVERDGRVILVMRDRGIAMTGEKVPAYEIPAAWRRRVGPFRIVNPDKHYLVDTTDPVLTVEDGRLLLRVKLTGIEEREIKVVMMPLDDERVYTFGLGRNVGDITQIVRRDGRELIRYLGYYFDCAGCEQALQRGQR
jgi:hypothetical protein